LCCRLLPQKAGTHRRVEITEAINAMTERGLVDPKDFVGMLPEFDKAAGERCQHQRLHGCGIYARRPFSCRFWNCRWLVNNDMDGMRRPDRAHYVVDIMPDFVTLQAGDAEPFNIEVVQIWIDPRHGDAWRKDAALMAYIERRAHEGIAALVRSDAKQATTVFAPPMASDKQWHEIAGRGSGEHRGQALIEGIAKARHVIIKPEEEDGRSRVP